MNRKCRLGIIILTAVFLVSFSPPGGKDKKTRKFIDPANMDLSVKPGDNFFLYANGAWVKKNPVPASKTRWGSFDQLIEDNSGRLHLLLEEAAHNPADNKFKKVGDYYASGLDSAAIEKLGYEPIKADMERINSLTSIQEVVNEMTYEKTNGMTGSLISINISQDKKNVSKYIPQIGQGGITLPDRDYYLKGDARNSKTRTEFLMHIANMFRLTGVSAADAAKKAEAVMRIETALAKAQLPRVEMRDQYKTYNKFAWKDLSATTPLLDWKNIAEKLAITGTDSVIVSNPSFVKLIDLLLGVVPVEDWKTYLQWHLLNDEAPYLSSAFEKENFNFNRVLSGQKEIQPRWQRISSQIDNSMGELLGELYVNKYFTAEAKKRMLDLVNNLQQTFADRIKRLDWMSDETKQKAFEKLNAFTKKIGYTDKWRDYSSVRVDRNDYIGNHRRAAKWAYDDMVSRLGKPVDKTRWGFTPPTVNASYNATNNEITFPAGILQFPFFDFDADDAVNYGGIGAVIGHEMTHGFDDQGRQSGADGNLTEWWTKPDADKFKSKADEVVNQYNAFTILDTIHVNGRLTLGENLADLGGVNIAYEAFTKTNQFKEGKKIDGFTPAQRFFLSYAQIWRSVILPEEAAKRILTDPHSPGMARANGPVSNIDAWYEAFNVQPGDKMYKPKEQRTRIW
ncbi:MAG: M13 family metallopeptidase [Chitinophagaceae bacterium]|nr:M13 family metallopeptidase [Chitinophagaceae bacterium]